MRNVHYRSETGGSRVSRPSVGYIYLVKNPANNEMMVCAWDSVLYPGTRVVYPTRYGLDLGVIVTDASQLGGTYTPGSPDIHGACSGCSASCAEKDDQPLVAAGEVAPDGSAQVDEIEWDEDPDEDPGAACEMYTDGKDPRKVSIQGDAVWIDRLATPSDLSRYQELRSREDEAMRVCREKIASRGLDMKLVTAHFLLGEPKVLFFFTADVRVDFRELVKDLVAVFRIRIELRQIGVRDESRLLGGLAICGRDFCCHAMTGKLSPVSIKMAKEQNLSLNSMKISGPCGRLLCCLAYEHDFYMEEKAKYPPEGSRLKLGDELMRVGEVNILSKTITLSGAEGRVVTVPASACYLDAANGRWEVSKSYADELFGEEENEE